MIHSFLINLLLAFVWTAVTGTVDSTNLLLGFVLGHVILLIAQPLIDVSGYHRRLWALGELLLVFLRELVVSTLRVALYIVRPIRHLEGGVIAVPMELESDLEITVFASLISLTPGTLSLDHSRDKKQLFIHCMDIENGDVEGETRRIKELLEGRVRAAFGRRRPDEAPRA